MNDPAVLWPWPWWTSLLVAAITVAIAWIGAKVFVRLTNRDIGKLTHSLQQVGMSQNEEAFSVVGKDHGMVVSDDRLAVVDLRNARVLKTITFRDLALLKIYEDGGDRIQYRLVTTRGGQTRKLSTPSIIQMAKFFALITQQGIPIEYIQE